MIYVSIAYMIAGLIVICGFIAFEVVVARYIGQQYYTHMDLGADSFLCIMTGNTILLAIIVVLGIARVIGEIVIHSVML